MLIRLGDDDDDDLLPFSTFTHGGDYHLMTAQESRHSFLYLSDNGKQNIHSLL